MASNDDERLRTEILINQMRLFAVAGIGLIELIHYHAIQLRWLGLSPIPAHRHHQQVVFLLLGWATAGCLIRFLARRRVCASRLAVFTDALFLTGLASIGEGQKSVWLAGYFVLLSSAALRRECGIIRLVCGLCVLGFLSIWRPLQWYIPSTPVLPLYQQLLFAAALGLTAHALRRTIVPAATAQTSTLARNGAWTSLAALFVAGAGLAGLEPIFGAALLIVALPAVAEAASSEDHPHFDWLAFGSLLALAAAAVVGFVFSVQGEYLLVDSFLVRALDAVKGRLPIPSGPVARGVVVFVVAMAVLLFADWTFSRRRAARR